MAFAKVTIKFPTEEMLETVQKFIADELAAELGPEVAKRWVSRARLKRWCRNGWHRLKWALIGMGVILALAAVLATTGI